mgnify:CR=1 FL=1
MQDTLTIRTAKRSDLVDVVKLWEDLMDFHGKIDSLFTRSEDALDKFHDFICKQLDSEKAEIFIAEIDGKIIGYSFIEISTYPPVFKREEYGRISDVVVTDEHRRKGIGQALFNTSMKWFSKKGMNRVELRVAYQNNQARGFWEKMGFKPVMMTMYREEEN